MKKNMMLRTASVLLIAVLMSTCAISGTFAKYVTSDSATDTARVAKFGVSVVAQNDSLFETQYAADDTYFGYADLSVAATEKVVAPGTKDNGAMTFSITGTPEVAVNVKFEVTVNKDVFLKAANDLPNMTTGLSTDVFDNTADYYPVVFTLKRNGADVATGNLSVIETEMEKLSKNYDPGTKLEDVCGDYTLTWAWAYGHPDSDAGYDMQDTLLGDLAAGTAAIDAALYNLSIDFEIKVTVTQID